MTSDNETLAGLLGWRIETCPVYATQWFYDADGKFVSINIGLAYDPRHFHKYVLPVLKERGLMEAWADDLASRVIGAEPFATTCLDGSETEHDAVSFAGLAACLAAPTKTKASAAIAVMQRKGDDERP